MHAPKESDAISFFGNSASCEYLKRVAHISFFVDDNTCHPLLSKRKEEHT
jgi:hypothetical protein